MSQAGMPAFGDGAPAAQLPEFTVEASRLADALFTLAGEVRLEHHSPMGLNQLAARIDQLGRRLHGLGWTREHDMGGCLSAAVGELSRARGVPEMERTASVRDAVHQLEAALTHTREGLRPQTAGAVTGLTAQGVDR